MKVWEVVPELKSMVIMMSNYSEDSEKVEFNGGKVREWNKLSFYTSVKGKYHDFPRYLPGIPVISRKAHDILQGYITDNVQFLPIDHPEELFLVNVHNVIDCIDYERSKYFTLRSGGFGELGGSQ